MLIDQAIDRLTQAYAQAGLPTIRPAQPDVDQILAAIATSISPFRLPVDVDIFWRRVDPQSITVAPNPRPTSPSFALETWQVHRDDAESGTPRVLFPLCYESHGFLFIELAGDRYAAGGGGTDAGGGAAGGAGSGGAIFSWEWAGSPFRLRHVSLAAYLDQLATMIELGEFTRQRLPDGSAWFGFDAGERWDDACAVRLSAAGSLPDYGQERDFDAVHNWPAHWVTATSRNDERP